MDFKHFFTKYKKGIIVIATTFFIGSILGFANTISKADYNKLISQKETASQTLDSINTQITTNSESLSQIEIEKKELENEINAILKEKQRIESERIEAEKLQKEKERLEQEKNAQQNNRSSNETKTNNASNNSTTETPPITSIVWKTKTGKKYHSHDDCGNSKTAVQVDLDEAKRLGLTACKNCY